MVVLRLVVRRLRRALMLWSAFLRDALPGGFVVRVWMRVRQRRGVLIWWILR